MFRFGVALLITFTLCGLSPRLLAQVVTAAQSDSATQSVPVAQSAPAPQFDLTQLPTHWQQQTLIDDHWRSRVFVVQAGLQHTQSVLLVHGLGGAGFTDWLKVIPELEKHFHVIAIDLPGFGRSSIPAGRYAPDQYAKVLASIATQLARGPLLVVGHSMGGAISLRYAADYPHQVSRLVLVSSAGILERTALLKLNAELALAVEALPQPVNRIAARVVDAGKTLIEKISFAPDATLITDHSDAAWIAVYGNRPQVNAAMGLIEHNLSDAIAKLTLPVFIIWGEHDRIAPLRTGQLLLGRLQHAQLKVIAEAEHMPMLTHSQLFNQYLLQALFQAAPEPRLAKFIVPASEDLSCHNQVGKTYTGNFRHIRLEGCKDMVLYNLQAESLTLINSTVTLSEVEILNPTNQERVTDYAVIASGSIIEATSATFAGEVALQSIASRWDLAGVSLRSIESAIEVGLKSTFVFSVSDVSSRTKNVYVHRIISDQQTTLF